MSRCMACDCSLSDVEATRKDIHGDYIELCNACFYPIRADVILQNHHDLNIVDSEND